MTSQINNLTNTPEMGILISQSGKIRSVRNASLSVSRRSNRAFNCHGFSMSERSGSRSRLSAPRGRSCKPSVARAPECKRVSEFRLNSRRPLVSANKTSHPKFNDIVDDLHNRAQAIKGATHALYCPSEHVGELCGASETANTFRTLRNLIEAEARKVNDLMDLVWQLGRAA